ncbi:hypothetical protein EDB85DRAFT_1889760 [Lactarius pseudohatsudake]|nr:hypothetical protein EDB85DRAFT_1889760 [Lactarius pseudohatsudake]
MEEGEVYLLPDGPNSREKDRQHNAQLSHWHHQAFGCEQCRDMHRISILTEGDSAKALMVAGLGVVGYDYFGVFPLRRKLLNLREVKHDQIMKNEEIWVFGTISHLARKRHC